MLGNVVDKSPKPSGRVVTGRLNRPDDIAKLFERLNVVMVVAECDVQPHVSRGADLALGAGTNCAEFDFAAVEAKSHRHMRVSKLGTNPSVKKTESKDEVI